MQAFNEICVWIASAAFTFIKGGHEVEDIPIYLPDGYNDGEGVAPR